MIYVAQKQEFNRKIKPDKIYIHKPPSVARIAIIRKAALFNSEGVYLRSILKFLWEQNC